MYMRKDFRMKKDSNSARVKRSTVVYGVCVAVLVLLSVIIAVTGANRRSEGTPKESADSGSAASSSELPAESEVSSEKLPGMSEYEPPLPPSTSSDEVNNEIEDKLPVFSAPIDSVLAKGYSVDIPVYSLTLNEYKTHPGIDISAAAGSPVKAVADGVIGDVWYDPMMGWCVSVIHSGGAISCYRNLSSEFSDDIAKDKAVASGAVLGCVGDSAIIEAADDAHLHFELAINGKTVDPLEYFELPATNGSYED